MNITTAHRLKRLQQLGLVLILSGVLLPWPAQAHLTSGSNCSGCHTTPKNGMFLTSHQATSNLGSGVLKVFKVSPGGVVPIGIQVTNNYGGTYGVTMNNLGTTAGVTNSLNRLAYAADPSWTSRTTYFTVGATSTSPKLWTFNLTVQPNTPPDTYVVQTIMAGRDVNSVRWSQPESFYIQVVQAAVPPTPVMLTPQRSGNGFSARVATAAGFTYYLEYKTTLGAGTWTTAAQATGDGTTKTLTDNTATDPKRFYRIRVQ